MESEQSVCRTCGQKNLSFCDLNHETIRKLRRFVPTLINCEDKLLPKLICITCYQMIKTIVFNLESIADMQEILKKIQNSSPLSSPATALATKTAVKRSFVEDFTKKFTNIKVRKIVAEKPAESIAVLPATSEKPPVREYKANTIHRNTIHRSLTKTPVNVQQTPKAESAGKLITTRTVVPTESSKVQLNTANKIQYKARCTRCNATFDRKEDADKHGKSCKGGSDKNHSCFCGITLPTSQELDKHMAECHNKSRVPALCKPCKKIFQTAAALNQHHESVHKASMTTLICTICNQKLKTEEDKKAHHNTCQRKSNEA